MEKNEKPITVSGKIKALREGEQCLIRRDEMRPSVARAIIWHIAMDYDKKFETKLLGDTLVVTRVK